MNLLISPSAYFQRMARMFEEQEVRSRDADRRTALRRSSLTIISEANLIGGEAVGGCETGTSAAAERAEDGDGDGGDGDPDPEPEPRRRHKHPQHPNPADSSVRRAAAFPSALTNFPLLPDDAFVRLPVVTGLYACSPATVWRHVKAGLIPAPVKLSERIAAWRVGDLRAALVSLSS